MIIEDSTGAVDGGEEESREETDSTSGSRNLVRLIKPVIVSTERGSM